MPSQVDLNLLRVLAVVLERRSVTQAAFDLGLSQPAVSRALARLRVIFGDPLFIRANGQMQLTHRAAQLAGPLRVWLADASGFLRAQSLEPATLRRHFRIAASDYGALVLLPPAISGLMSAAPGLAIQIEPLSRDSQRRLVAGDLDLLFSAKAPDPALSRHRRLFSEELVCVVRRDHPLVGQMKEVGSRPGAYLGLYLAHRHLSLTAEFDGTDPVDTQLAARDLVRKKAVVMPYYQLAAALLRESDLVATVPLRLAERLNAQSDELVRLPAPSELHGFDFHAMWSERSRDDQALLWLIDTLARSVAPAGAERAAPAGVLPAATEAAPLPSVKRGRKPAATSTPRRRQPVRRAKGGAPE